MATQLQQELNSAQACIYTRTNIRRAYQDFDDTEVAGIYLRDDYCLVVRRDGSEQTYDRQLIRNAYVSYTSRLKDFFSYLGPHYRGPSLWRYNSFVLFKGWNYVHQLSHNTVHAKLQQQWADKFIRITDHNQLISILQSDQTDLGHLIAPEGLRLPDGPVDLDRDLVEEQHTESIPKPWCSCGSFQRQLNNLSLFQQEIQGYQPTCIHLSWFNRYRQFLCQRTAVRDTAPGGTPDKCVAWYYMPPTDEYQDGKFVVLYTTNGMHAPITHWRTYKPNETYTRHDAWDLFSSMMEAGYVPFPGTALPQLQSAIKKK